MSLSIYTYSNPYEINNEPYWDSIRNCAHFCVSQTMVNGLSAVYDELDNGQLATVEELVEALYPRWFDTKTYIEQYTILTNTLDKVTPNIEPDRWKKIKQSLRFNKSALLDSIRLMAEMGLLLKNIKIKKITEEQIYLVAAYNAILRGENAEIFALKRNFSEREIDNAVKTALVAKDKRRGKEVKSIESVDCNTVVIHGIHQFKENELYYILKLLGVKTEKNIHDTTNVHEKQNITFDLGKNTNNFVDLDGFRRRICGYRFALESLIENGTKYQDRFLQTKYLEIILANNVRRKLEGQIATEAIMNEALDDSAERLRRYFRFLNESEITDIKSNTKSAIIHQALQDGKIRQFPKVTDIDSEMMRKKEEFIYLHLENENQENVLLGKFNDLTVAEKKQFLPDNLKNASYDKEANIWCQWCAVREKCLENYKSLVEI